MDQASFWTVVFSGLGGLFGASISVYFKEKGKNLATKEDIGMITHQVEAAKSSYNEKLEGVKAELAATMRTHGYRYEKEFEYMVRLTESLVDVRSFVLQLRPVLDFRDDSKSKEQIKAERLHALSKARETLWGLREKGRPFFTETIYRKLLEFDEITIDEVVGYSSGGPFDADVDFKTYWDEVQANHKKISDLAEESMALIRQRIMTWDKTQ